MTDSPTTQTKSTKAQKQATPKPESSTNNTINLRPLPQNRPIATNVPMAGSIDALLGYLD